MLGNKILIVNRFRRLVTLFILFFRCSFSNAQDSSHIRISLLTCTPGDELYSTFGHSALRITDSSSVFDVVFNYGTFNFDDNNFYLKFIRGKLLYFVSADNFSDFKNLYQADNRGITEQVLNFSPEEKLKIEAAMFNNIKEKNKYYKYDFFFDNCTTRLRDIIVKSKNPPPIFRSVMPAGTTFRDAIHTYLDAGDKDWSKLGIDLLLGAKTDRVMSVSESQFLPDILMQTIDSIHSQNRLLIKKSSLYPFVSENANLKKGIPLLSFCFLLVLIIGLSFSKNKFIQKILPGFDGILFFLTGLLGLLIVFMWTATDHIMCSNNWNLWWAFPLNLVAAFFVGSTKDWIKKYFLFLAISLSGLLLCWHFLSQHLNTAYIPVVLLMIFRSVSIYFKINLGKNNYIQK